MTKAQEKIIEKIQAYVLEMDYYHNHPDYEIKRFEVGRVRDYNEGSGLLQTDHDYFRLGT